MKAGAIGLLAGGFHAVDRDFLNVALIDFAQQLRRAELCNLLARICVLHHLPQHQGGPEYDCPEKHRF